MKTRRRTENGIAFAAYRYNLDVHLFCRLRFSIRFERGLTISSIDLGPGFSTAL